MAKVLVVDDNPNHRASAHAFLKGHDLTVVGTYDEAENVIGSEQFDVVLFDLMIPASRKAQAGKGMQFVGQEMPIGTTLGFFALSKGVKNVAVVTDTNHHDHPASATFDEFSPFEPFAVGDARILLVNCHAMTFLDPNTNEQVTKQFLETREGEEKYPRISENNYQGLLYVKGWHYLLKRLSITS
jgi:hypothetical protein